MTFAHFAQYLEELEVLSSRLDMTAKLASLFNELEQAEVIHACYLLQGQLQPSYESIEFQISVKTVIKALARVLATQQSSVESKTAKSVMGEENLFGEQDFSAYEKTVNDLYHKLGDLGLTAVEVCKSAQAQSLSIEEIYQQLVVLAKDSGVDSQRRKLERLVQLLSQLDASSAKFVVRIILGRLRLGFSDMTMIDALSWAMTGNKREHDQLELAYQKKADIGKLAETYLSEKDEQARRAKLARYSVEVGVPVIPALCQRLNSAAEMIEKMHDVIAEPKYDGLRVQIHVQKQKNGETMIRTFTRNLEETSHMFPELRIVIDQLDCQQCILDSEAIGYDPESGELLPFQQTVQRKRKHDIAETAESVPIRFYVFDVLALDNQDLLSTPLYQRKEKLQKLFKDSAVLYHSPELRTTDPKVLHDYHEENLAAGLEGVVVKQFDAPYQSGRKGWSWVKMKEAEGTTGKLSDTIDAVVMGYYYGRGKRASFGIGAILVGILGDNDQIVTLAKIGTGLTEEVLRQTKVRCDALATPTMPSNYVVNKLLAPNIWCSPGFVVEVAADELTRSPLHSAGLALRFPRLVKFRDDKTWQQATTLEEVPKMWKTLKEKA